MKMNYQIELRFNSGRIIFFAENESLRLTMEFNVRTHANLEEAYLAGACLVNEVLASEKIKESQKKESLLKSIGGKI